MKFRPVANLFWLLIFGLAFGSGVALAHGGGTPQLVNAQAGPYWVSVWTQPDPLRVGQVHFTIAVAQAPARETDPEPGPPVLGATVELHLQPADQNSQPLIVLATHEAAVNKLFYEVDVELPTAGQWLATVSVETPTGAGSTHFTLEVAPPARANWPMWATGLSLVGLGAGWLGYRLWKR